MLQRKERGMCGTVMSSRERSIGDCFALGLLACCILLIFGMISLSSKSRIVPYVVAVDAIGRAEAVSPAEAAAPVDERVKRAILLSWIQDVRSVSSDRKRNTRR
jgi:type IV secretory pathway TrbF-like protein